MPRLSNIENVSLKREWTEYLHVWRAYLDRKNEGRERGTRKMLFLSTRLFLVLFSIYNYFDSCLFSLFLNKIKADLLFSLRTRIRMKFLFLFILDFKLRDETCIFFLSEIKLRSEYWYFKNLHFDKIIFLCFKV